MNNRGLTLCAGVAAVAITYGVGQAGPVASVGGTRLVGRPRTLLAENRRIYAFALGAHRITWISRTHKRGRYPGCEMYVRRFGTSRTSRAPLPRAGCGVTPPLVFAAQKPVLANGVAAWVTASSCGNNECFWKIATITGGETTRRIVESADVDCDYTCDNRFDPRPALAGNSNLLVYSAGLGGDPDTTIDHVRRIVGRHSVPFAVPAGDGNTVSLVVGGGAVEAINRVFDPGDGCGCLDAPAWSPDGSKIAYLQGTFYNQRVYPVPPSGFPAVMNADASARRDLVATDQANEGPVWSPDGRQLAYAETSSTRPFPEVIAVVNADGSGAHEIGPGDDPSWSPDGSKIAFASAGCANTTAAISVMNPDGTGVQQLASFAPGPTCLGDGGIAWSPDGTRIAFSLNGTLEVMNADGSNRHPLGSETLGDEPSWSPDSSHIVFHEASGLWVIGADGSSLRQLTNGPTDEQPSWSPDGKTIVFGSDRNDPYAKSGEVNDRAFPELYLVDADGSGVRPLSFTRPSVFEQQETFYTGSGKRLPSLPSVPTLAGNVAAVGSTNSNGGHEITLFNATTGAQLAVVEVGANPGEFDVAGADSTWIVFRLGVNILALNARSHRVARLARAPADPIDLSVAGRRVAWAENIHGQGRIRSFDLPK